MRVQWIWGFGFHSDLTQFVTFIQWSLQLRGKWWRLLLLFLLCLCKNGKHVFFFMFNWKSDERQFSLWSVNWFEFLLLCKVSSLEIQRGKNVVVLYSIIVLICRQRSMPSAQARKWAACTFCFGILWCNKMDFTFHFM